MYQPCFRPVAAGVALVLSATAASAAPPMHRSTDVIALSRHHVSPGPADDGTNLWLTNSRGSTVHQLTPFTEGKFDYPRDWSPGGTFLVFTRADGSRPYYDTYDLYTIHRSGRRLRQITTGIGNFLDPEWGPRSHIAFISEYEDYSCVSMVQWNGQHRRDLFCPAAGIEVQGVEWAADGRSLLIETGYYGSGLEPPWHSQAYRLDTRTGALLLLTEQILDEPLNLIFAPDGSYGLYADHGYSTLPMRRIDFGVDALVPVTRGHSPVFSGDGNLVAFTRQIFSGEPDRHTYDQLFVMNADGSDIRQVTDTRVNNIEYIAIDWSDDDNRLLVERAVYRDEGPSSVRGEPHLYIADIADGTMRWLTQGGSYGGAWHER